MMKLKINKIFYKMIKNKNQKLKEYESKLKYQ